MNELTVKIKKLGDGAIVPTFGSEFAAGADLYSAEETLTVSSGAEVPNATIVSPITIGGIRKRLATEAEPSVNPLAPRRMRISPPIRNNIFIAFSV